MDSSHETFSDSPVVVEDLGDWGKAVGGAGGVGDDLHIRGVLVSVDAHDEEWGVVLGWGREDGLLGTALKVEATLWLVKEDTSGLADVVSAGLAPWDVDWVLLGEEVNEVAVDLDAAVSLLDGAVEAAYMKLG